MASKVLWHVTASLDGFITGPEDAMDWSFSFRRNRIADRKQIAGGNE